MAPYIRSSNGTLPFPKFVSQHLTTQSPSLIPPGILSSCNNIFIAQLKHPKGRDLAIVGVPFGPHRSEKGLVDETWRRFLASLPVARSVVKLGYSFERAEPEPTDREIEGALR